MMKARLTTSSGKSILDQGASFELSAMLAFPSKHQIDPETPNFNPLNSFIGDFKR
jgi:hypothetical protein